MSAAADGSRSANLYLLPLGADANESLPACRRPLDGNNPSVKNQRFLPAPFTQGSLFSEIGGIGMYKFHTRYGIRQKKDGYYSRPLSIYFGFICAAQDIIYAYIVELS